MGIYGKLRARVDSGFCTEAQLELVVYVIFMFINDFVPSARSVGVVS